MISKVSKFVVIGKEKEREYKINIRFKIANIHAIFGKKKKMHTKCRKLLILWGV